MIRYGYQENRKYKAYQLKSLLALLLSDIDDMHTVLHSKESEEAIEILKEIELRLD